jgi:hypothetical protein
MRERKVTYLPSISPARHKEQRRKRERWRILAHESQRSIFNTAHWDSCRAALGGALGSVVGFIF